MQVANLWSTLLHQQEVGAGHFDKTFYVCKWSQIEKVSAVGLLKNEHHEFRNAEDHFSVDFNEHGWVHVGKIGQLCYRHYSATVFTIVCKCLWKAVKEMSDLTSAQFLLTSEHIHLIKRVPMELIIARNKKSYAHADERKCCWIKISGIGNLTVPLHYSSITDISTG